MPQTLRTHFSIRSHRALQPMLRQGFSAPLSLQAFLTQLQRYVIDAKQELLQPRQSTLDIIFQEIRS